MRGVKKMVVTFAAVTTLVGSVACTTPDKDFWGNSKPTGTPVPHFDDTCVASDADPAQAAFDPLGYERPPGVRPGNSWIVVGLEVRALSPIGSGDYCVPIALHLYNRSGEADALTIDSRGVPAQPLDYITTTPFVGRYMALQYDPTQEQFTGRPPTYDFHLDATYLEERDLLNTERPVALRCAITIWGATIVQDLALVSERRNVSCSFTGNDQWRHF